MTSSNAKLEQAKQQGQQLADAWNAAHPVGIRVIAYPSVRPEFDTELAKRTRLVTTTRSTAWALGHGSPVVSVHGYAGGIRLDHVDIDHDSPLRGGERLAHVLTVDNISRIDNWLDRIDVFAKGYWESVDGKLVNTGLRIGEKPGHVVAKFGDTIIWRADGSFTVRKAVAS
jgi:hypothetical protein